MAIYDGIYINEEKALFKAADILGDGIDTKDLFYGYNLESGYLHVSSNGDDSTMEENDVQYYLVTIPKVNYDGERTAIKTMMSNPDLNQESTMSYGRTVQDMALELRASIAINGGYFHRETGTMLPYGIIIIDGRLVYQGEAYIRATQNQTLGIMPDGSFSYYNNDTVTASQMLNDGVLYSIVGRFPLVHNGVSSSQVTDYYYEPGHTERATESLNRMSVLCCDDDNYYTFTTEPGMTIAAVVPFLINKGIQEAYLLDGGGSASLNLMGVKLNSNKTEAGEGDREVGQCIYVARENDNPNTSDFTVASLLCKFKDNIDSSGVIPIEMTRASGYYTADLLPLNTIANAYYYTGGTPTSTVIIDPNTGQQAVEPNYNQPKFAHGTSWMIYTVGVAENKKIQLAIRRSDDSFYYRAYESTAWRSWQKVGDPGPIVLTVPANRSAKVTISNTNNSFSWAAIIETCAGAASCVASWFAHGYGTGATRYKLAPLTTGDNITASVSSNSIIVTNNSSVSTRLYVNVVHGTFSYFSAELVPES